MSASPEQADFEKLFTVFDGSSPADVSHARQLWSSLSLLPPQESRLVSADIRQRLPVSRPQQRGSTGRPGAGAEAGAPRPPWSLPAAARRQEEEEAERQEERQRYLTMADQRREILALLRRQRELRVQKELLSLDFKPKKTCKKELKTQKTEENETDEELLVRQLQ